jgi:hypothetical protein
MSAGDIIINNSKIKKLFCAGDLNIKNSNFQKIRNAGDLNADTVTIKDYKGVGDVTLKGLCKSDIFVAIADIYDAMTTERVYRKEIPPIAAIHVMLSEMYNKLDSITCLTLSTKLLESLIGRRVLLSNGKQGKEEKTS